jgi:hypothetical protein
VIATRALVGATILLLAACGEEDPPDPAPAPEPVEQPAEAPAGHGSSADEIAPPPARMVRSQGTVTVGGVAAAPGSAIEAEEPIGVPEDGRAVVQLRDGGRVEIDGPARARVVDEGGAQIFLIRGRLYAVQPPMGNSPRPPLRIVSPGATVEIGAAGEIYLASYESGASWVAVLGGAAAVENGEADVRRRLHAVDLSAGQAVAVPSRIAEPTEGPSRLSAAREAAEVFAATETPDEDGARQRRDLAHEADRLDQALQWLETEARRGRELTAQHSAAVQAGDGEESSRLQRELVEHSRALYRMRRLATARWERLRVHRLRMRADGHATAADPVEARRDRVVGLLGL